MEALQAIVWLILLLMPFAAAAAILGLLDVEAFVVIVAITILSGTYAWLAQMVVLSAYSNTIFVALAWGGGLLILLAAASWGSQQHRRLRNRGFRST